MNVSLITGKLPVVLDVNHATAIQMALTGLNVISLTDNANVEMVDLEVDSVMNACQDSMVILKFNAYHVNAIFSDLHVKIATCVLEHVNVVQELVGITVTYVRKDILEMCQIAFHVVNVSIIGTE